MGSRVSTTEVWPGQLVFLMKKVAHRRRVVFVDVSSTSTHSVCAHTRPLTHWATQPIPLSTHGGAKLWESAHTCVHMRATASKGFRVTKDWLGGDLPVVSDGHGTWGAGAEKSSSRMIEWGIDCRGHLCWILMGWARSHLLTHAGKQQDPNTFFGQQGAALTQTG
mgnify:CR=1 FL=1|jgi:hypothetical protein